ncbi:reticulon-4-interacting protein 1 homolog, mitochondrial isoform X2 [Aplysia californica]|uniref:Reticulon-4-interacting protein 1 homolog, mitochondrial isoform X2 n=1 Tax=Aplysia californica TaxID=6500 RepID=A0ABM1VSF1_APLCA|nr:reticulon-4-interacting protein 1 homolog, mitochondrial isoform X2 [Aplysia californica]
MTSLPMFGNVCRKCRMHGHGVMSSLRLRIMNNVNHETMGKVTPICASPVAIASSIKVIWGPVKYYSSYSGATKMSAWQIHQYGRTEELSFVKATKAATIKSPNEILVKVHAASVNPIDVRMMDGYGRKLINVLRAQKGFMKSGTEFPLILGRDFSGTVIETGRGVKKFQAGDEVWGALSPERPGTHAEYAVVSQDEISLKPKNIMHTEAASIPYVAATTWAALCTVGELREHKAAGKRLLVLGGSGGIGTFAIQLAKSWGMHVTTTCSGDAIDLVTALGADVAVDYKTGGPWRQLGQMSKFDLILDTIGGESTSRAASLLGSWKNSKLVTIVSPILKNSDNLGVLPGLVKTALNAGVDTLMWSAMPTAPRNSTFNLRSFKSAERFKVRWKCALGCVHAQWQCYGQSSEDGGI